MTTQMKPETLDGIVTRLEKELLEENAELDAMLDDHADLLEEAQEEIERVKENQDAMRYKLNEADKKINVLLEVNAHLASLLLDDPSSRWFRGTDDQGKWVKI